MTAPILFAKARGEPYQPGGERCFYCGAICGRTHKSAELVKDSFTSRDTVAGGEYVCGGCVASMNERAAITLPDGEQRAGQKVRCYTWVLTRDKATAATKAHRDYLLGVCCNPPPPPFVVCLSDSGQKHLLYRAVVCHAQDVVTVTLEGERITYQPSQLIHRITLCKQVAAALGKPALSEPLSVNQQMLLVLHYGDDSILSSWLSVRGEPLSRLAAWFTPAKADCLLEYPKHEPTSDSTPRSNQHRGISQTSFGFD